MLNMNPAFHSSAEMSSNAWTTHADQLNINIQNESASDNEREYLK
jgi:hypothetical protein